MQKNNPWMLENKEQELLSNTLYFCSHISNNVLFYKEVTKFVYIEESLSEIVI